MTSWRADLFTSAYGAGPTRTDLSGLVEDGHDRSGLVTGAAITGTPSDRARFWRLTHAGRSDACMVRASHAW